MGDINLLVINPGSTSTKIAIYENGKELYRKNLTHSADRRTVSKDRRSGAVSKSRGREIFR